MNAELIENFTREAGITPAKPTSFMGAMAAQAGERARERLVELAVRECINLIEAEAVGQVGTHASAHNSAIKKCRDSILQRFELEAV